MTDTRLYNVYLISGAYDHASKSVIEKSAVPVRDTFFSRLNHQEHTLITTDEHGLLGSIGNGGNKLARINDQCLGPMRLVPVPPGVARLSYFAHDKEWQNKLVDHIREMNPQNTLDPIPVEFKKEHLQPAAANDSTEVKLLEHFTAGRTYKGQLIPRFHVLAVVIDHRVLGTAPQSLIAHHGERVIRLRRSAKPASMGEPPSCPQSWVYSASGQSIKEGTYIVEIDPDCVAQRFRNEGGKTIRRTLEVTFSVHSLFGDYDFQVLDFPTVEGAILTHFAEKYPHILVDDQAGPSDKRANPAYEQAEGALAQYRQTAGLLDARRKMAVGFVNADSSTKARQIISSSLGAIRDSKTEGVSDAAELAAKMCDKAYEGQEMYKAWKEVVAKYSIKLDNAKELALVRQVMDDKAIANFFHKTEWQQTAINAIHQSQEKQPNLLGRYLLWRKDKADPAVLKKLMQDASSPRLSAFELAASGKLPSPKSLATWALDTKNTIQKACETISALQDLLKDEANLDSSLREALAEYVKKCQVRGKGGHDSGFAPCTEAIPRMEVLRKTADAASVATDKKILEAAKQAAHLTLQAVSLVPATQPFMSLASQVGSSLEALGSVVDVASEAIDRYLFRHRSSISRFAELARLHMLQVRAIANADKGGKNKHDDPYTQFRLRVIVLIGLLRLIERCGSKNDKDFDQKVIDNDIEGYLGHYVFSNNFPIALSSGTPLDEIWTYGCTRKRFDWKDVEARVMSLGDSIADLIRGTKTVYVPVMFQRYFPICGKSSASAKQLARAFSLDFSGVIDSDMVFSRIYVRRNPKEKWVGVEEAKFPIEPGTPVRVAAIFKNKDRSNLSGVPMSLQVVRVDCVCSIEGPVYTSSLAHVWQSAEAEDGHEDKGLLAYVEDEKRYIGDKDAYSCVFYPFYFFQKKLVYGLKPLGHIGLSGDVTFDVSLSLKAGDDGKYIDAGKRAQAARVEAKSAAFYPVMGQVVAAKAALDEAKGRTVRVHMPTRNRVYVDMILNKQFLEHKDAKPNWENMFKHEWQRYQVGGVYWRGKEGVWKYSGTEKGHFVTKLGPSQFAWGETFELLVVFSSVFASQQRWPGDPIKVPGYIDVKELSISGGGDEVRGPAYPVEIVSLHRDRKFKGTVDAMTIQNGLHNSGLLKTNEHFVPAGFGLIEESVLWAVRARFEFQIQGMNDEHGKPGLLQAQAGMRPFGKAFMDNYGGYIYRFGLSAPGNIGLQLPNVAEFTVPGVPDGAFPKSFLAEEQRATAGGAGQDEGKEQARVAKWKWVTDEKLCKSLEVRKPQ